MIPGGQSVASECWALLAVVLVVFLCRMYVILVFLIASIDGQVGVGKISREMTKEVVFL